MLDNVHKLKEYVVNNYKKYSKDLAEKYKNYLLISNSINNNKSKLEVQINHKLIQERLNRCGFFVAITNDALTPKEMLITKEKEIV